MSQLISPCLLALKKIQNYSKKLSLLDLDMKKAQTARKIRNSLSLTFRLELNASFSPPNKRKPSKDSDLNQRAILYKLENSEEQACKDVMNVIKSNNQKELSKNFNQIPHILQHTAIDLKINENFKSLDHSNPLPNNEESKDLSKEC